MEDKTCLRSCKTTRRWANTTFNITEINQYLNDLVHEYRHVDFTNTFLEKKNIYTSMNQISILQQSGGHIALSQN